MNEVQLKEVENKIKQLSNIERGYFRELLMQNYTIYAMAYDVRTMVDVIDGVGVTYEKFWKLIEGIHDHSTWTIDESLFIQDEKDGIYDE